MKLIGGCDRVQGWACAVCRINLHFVDGDLLHPQLPLVPSVEILVVRLIWLVEALQHHAHDRRMSALLGRRKYACWRSHRHCEPLTAAWKKFPAIGFGSIGVPLRPQFDDDQVVILRLPLGL